MEIEHTIYDKAGKAYIVEGHLSSSALLSVVSSEHKWIGRINWVTSEQDFMDIADLHIFDPPHKKLWWMWILPFLYKKPPNYRGCGLGSAMLEFIIQSARNMGISEIRGTIKSDDLKKTPYLPTFYRKHGFTVMDDMRFYQVL